MDHHQVTFLVTVIVFFVPRHVVVFDISFSYNTSNNDVPRGTEDKVYSAVVSPITKNVA
jgi:hypothetical protein